MRRQLLPRVGTAVVLASLTACGGTVDGSPQADPTATAAKLDAGNYKTSPTEVKAVAPADAWQQEAFLLADSVPAPWEIDPAFSKSTPKSGSTPVLSTARTGGMLDTTAGDKLTLAPQTGFVATASSIEGGRLAVGAFRYATEDEARRAVDLIAIRASNVGAPDGSPDNTEVVVLGNVENRRWTTLATVRGNMVLLGAAEVVGVGESSRLSAKAIAAQVEKIKNYKPTPKSAAVAVPEVPMDTADSMMKYTLSVDPGVDRSVLGLSAHVGYGDGYLSPHTFSLMIMQDSTERTNKYGIEQYAVRQGATLTRLKSEQTARFYFDDFVAPTTDTKATVPGIARENARCSELTSGGFRCGVWTGGRYTASVSGKNLQQAQQAASAQYLIMKQMPS
ncbi:DUF7373 family lipoprotein [Tsukamurella spumae]|uniref:Lipoprotein n=1 Tax=Tsukamurella spumae TaxID=44753 RepID=A0A846X1C1_9ACTN|nr:hypothetical protein [Tsukamurella spumae]NKY18376.1 hypothetical protein [Tsukamurella spumae]